MSLCNKRNLVYGGKEEVFLDPLRVGPWLGLNMKLRKINE